MRQALENTLDGEPAPSVTELAERFGYTCSRPLYAACPELCHQITKRYRTSARYLNQKFKQPRKKDDETIRAALIAALNQVPPPTLGDIAAELGYRSPHTIVRRFPDLCRRVVEKRETHRLKVLKRIEAKLKKILKESPPPSSKDVAARFGHKRLISLAYYFPDLCKAIQSRHAAWRAEVRGEAANKLRAALLENPPPRLIEVLRRYSYHEFVMRGRYPELCRAISERRKEYMRRVIAERDKKLEGEVGRVVLELLENGMNPAIKVVTGHLPDQSAAQGKVRRILRTTLLKMRLQVA